MLNKIYYFLRKPRQLNQKKYLLISGLAALAMLVFISWKSFFTYHQYFFSRNNFFIFQDGHLDYLMLYNHLMMTFFLLRRPNVKIDLLTAMVAYIGGLYIESWGTQSQLWVYFTLERPPIWIVPSWIVLTISIDRFYEMLNHFFKKRDLISKQKWQIIYWLIVILFLFFMFRFVYSVLFQSLTLFSVTVTLFYLVFVAIYKKMYRESVLIFIAGSILGFGIELWGTSRHIWTYYNHEIPPMVVVFGHGAVSIVFWYNRLFAEYCLQKYRDFLNKILPLDPSLETKSSEKS